MSVLKIKNSDNQWVEIPTINGKSAYAYAVDGGYTGTEAQFALKLAQENVASVNGRTGAVTGLIDAPSVVGTEGQVLGLDSNHVPVWMNQSGGGGSENWELISEFIPDEDVNLININKDSNGNSFALKKCMVYIKAQATGVTSNNNKMCAGFSKGGNGADIDFNNAPDVNSVNQRTFGAYCEANGYLKRTIWFAGAPDYNARGYVTWSDGVSKDVSVYEMNSNYITNFAVRINVSGALFDHTKTIIHIVGVRA